MGLNQFFDENLVFCLNPSTQEELFDQVADLLESRNVVKSTYRAAIKEREKSFPTGLDMEFLGKELPNVSFGFFIINNSSTAQTNILAQLMEFFTGSGHLEELSKLETPAALYRFISEATAE